MANPSAQSVSNKLWVLALVLFSSFALGQDTVFKTGFVNSQKVLAAHPLYEQLLAAQDNSKTELEPMLSELKDLYAKLEVGRATPEERERFNALRVTYSQALERNNATIKPLLDTISADADVAIGNVAVQEGFQIVMDKRVSAQGLVVYAESELDLTDAVIERLKTR